MAGTAKIGTVRYIRRDYDARDAYVVGEHVTFKWHRRWRIEAVNFNETTGFTNIKLIRVSDR